MSQSSGSRQKNPAGSGNTTSVYENLMDEAMIKLRELEKLNKDLKDSNRTFKKQLAETLKENEFYNEIVDEVDALIYINKFLEDGSYKTIWMNKQTEDATGYSLAEVQAIGSYLQHKDSFTDSHIDLITDSWKFFQKTPEDIYTGVYKRQTKDGDWKWFYVLGHVIKTKPDGTPDECLCVSLDFSRRIETDKYLRELLNENLRLKYELEISRLTNREKQVLELIAQGKTNRDMAEHLSVSNHTVDTHRKNLLHKLGFRNSAELVKFATECGII